MTALGVLGLDGASGELTARAVHPRGRWVDGWNLHPTHHHIRAVADLDGDGRDEAVVVSDWGIGILAHDGVAFRCPFGAPRGTAFGRWEWDAPTRTGRDRILGAGRFTSEAGAGAELLVWSETGIATLARTAEGLTATRRHLSGARWEGWTLEPRETHCWGRGRFGDGPHHGLVLTTPRRLGIVSLERGAAIAVGADGERLGGWTLRTATDRVRLVADLDGDGQDELLVTGTGGVAVLKPVGGRFVALAVSPGASGPDSWAGAAVLRAEGGPAEAVLNDHRGLHVLRLSGTSLVRRAFAPNGSRVDGWLVDSFVNHLLSVGDVTGGGGGDFLIRSPWGMALLGVGEDGRFRCRAGRPNGSMLGRWRLAGSDVVAGSGRFTRAGGAAELLMVKPFDQTAPAPRFVATEFVNWHRNVRRSLPTARPADLAGLVAAVRAAAPGVGVAGSGWSFTDCVASEGTRSLIDTSALREVLHGVVPEALDDRPGRTDRHLLHVEAGIKLHDLNCRLDGLGWAMPTLGGSRGQSLAGALGTGVHGADVSLPPIADAVRAVHLVGAGGQQWWIEPATAPLTSRQGLDRAKARGHLDPSVRQVWDDEWFNALLVSMGCAGVIYSVVLAARPAFRLRTTTTAESWPAAQRRVADLAFRDRRPRYLEINVNPADGGCRVTVREETTERVSPPAGGGGGEVPIGLVAAAAGLLGPTALGGGLGALGLVLAAVGDYVARVTAEVTLLLAIPFVGVWLAHERAAQALRPVADAHRLLVELHLLAVDPHDARRVAELLPTVVNLLWAIGFFVVPGRTLVDGFQAMLTARERPEGTAVGASFRVMTGQPGCGADGAQSHDETARLVQSFEYAVPDTRAVAFTDRLIAEIAALRRGPDALVVNLNLRFTGRTRATLGMQRFERTCHVEIYTFRGMRGNAAFHRRLAVVVAEFGAVPHWGQLHGAAEAGPFARDGAARRWRAVMRSLSGGDEAFWSGFARARGLLP
ncbi:FAD-binding protein [Streptomyces sp. DSM 44917]|uniref:FAD-binding protein n=1 Tax=Streptomyces boetiae TaxID=3075541 RepID=A0ABU2LD11_9ACTN|nr:FAD-binding protein [Streptomyces sp. DSM 44917]MDT0309460.1 FAD-binding protein [Streptomyces sp. DSM 44917]